ncbi:flagellar hook protein FlgE [Microvirga massiliensis]|uniref:flagellar hook protein FlgE n=1 Tax=Microvirga massiliensis TaxID=1033741 RepID=UPI00062B794B|nr:flagellar hook protein FlgE [Microvirga massiliensis]
MGIFGAMTTAVSGLRAQSYALENISGNIANSQTTGFKRVDTRFVDLVPELSAGREIAGSVTAFSRLTNTLQGDLQPTGISTNAAINGEGFFVVQEQAGYANNQPIFGGVDLYTRRGDFHLDKDGYLVNGAGFYLRGSSIDPRTGAITGNANSVIRISSDPIPARATTTINYGVNLPTRPAVPSADPTDPDSYLLTGLAGADIAAENNAAFTSKSISGGSVTAYNSVGTPVNVQLQWAKTSNAAGAETWELFYLSNSAATTGQTMWTRIGQVEFDGSGAMKPPLSTTISGLTVDGVPVGNVTLNFGNTGLTQYATSSGLVQAGTLEQDGYPSGVLDAIQILSDGRIAGSYTNGRVVPVAEIPIVQFNADNALRRLDSGVYERTLESGLPIVGLNGSTLIGGHVEGSNTDIAEEFSKMIVTQQAYSANTRVVSTSQQMMTEIINMVR